MDKELRVLLLTAEAWRKDDSGGNTMDNFFNGMKGVKFAHVYCCDALPDNTVCEDYFQISESEVIHGFFSHKRVGHKLEWPLSEIREDSSVTEKHSSRFFSKIKSRRPQILLFFRLFIWRYSNWKTLELEAFVKGFNPDVIYAPCYASPFQLALTRHIKKMTGKKIVTWSADDNYSLRQINFSPLYWIIRFWNRYCLRKTYPYYDEFFSISEDEIKEMSPIVGRQMKILRKGVVVPEFFVPRDVHTPIRFIYAGGLYLNRDKSLIAIADALRKVNVNGTKAELHIYTGTKLNEKSTKLLNDEQTSFIHGLISSEELATIYKESDVAIHCESFDLRNKLATRLSFSTKVIDCFQSGCAILCIAWKEHTALKFLKKEDAAFCVTSVKGIEPTVRRIVENPNLIPEYARKAYECEKKKHNIEMVQRTLLDSFRRLSEE